MRAEIETHQSRQREDDMADLRVSIHRSQWPKLPYEAQQLIQTYAGDNPFGFPDANGIVTWTVEEGRWREIVAKLKTMGVEM